MPGGNNNYRGRGRGSRGNSNDRGQGQGRGRGRGRGRGQGRGQHDDDRPHGGRYPHTEMDYIVQVWAEPPSNFPRGGGRGGPPRSGSGSATPQRGGSTPRRGGKWRARGGSDSPRGRPGFGANVNRNGPEPVRPNAPLSKLLYSERPFLKPIIFVPSVYTRTLFEEVEDILQPVAESAGASEESHVPTADRVTRVFSGGDPLPPLSSSSEDGHSEEELEELDFADMGKLREQIDALQSSTDARVVPVASSLREEVFTGMYNNHNHHHDTSSSHHVHVTPGDTDLAPTDTLIGETNTTSTHKHNISPFENSTTVVATEDDEIVIEKSGTTPVSSSPKVSVSDEINTSPADPTGDDAPTFVIDTQPTRPFAHRSASDVILFDSMRGRAPLGEDDELIVYVAPHPRSGRSSPIPDVPRVRLPSRSMLTGTTSPAQNLTTSISPEDTSESKSVPGQPSEPLQFSSVSFSFASPDVKKRRTIFTSGDSSKTRAQARKSVRRRARRRQAMFGSFGAMLSEARLREADERERKDPRWESRRQDDSDIDWGDDDKVPEDDGVDEVSNGLGGMDLDPDLEPNLQVMQSFVKSMSAEGSRHITIDDIEDQERMKIEDEEDENDSYVSSSDCSDEDDDEVKAVLEVEEEILIAESQGERAREPPFPEGSNEEEDSSDNELSPRGCFEAKLRRIREKSRATQPVEQAPGDEELSDASLPPRSRANADEDYISHIEDLLEKHSGIIDGKDRKRRKQLFRAIQNGEFDERDDYVEWNDSFSYEEMQPARRMKDKIKGLPAELQVMWEKDRVKKAERKQAREEARLLASIDALAPKKGGKKGRKAMQAAANLDPNVLAQLPNAIVDMDSLEKQIRRFLSDVSGKQNIVLPPMEKSARKRVHELANAFGLKSLSKGKGDGRYITLIKTKRTNFVNEQKVRKIVKSHPSGYKDGDEVGKAAPKIGETNVGFKMLASMGWTEGDRIGGGASTGINAPLTAIIKKTKLGLGASR